MCGIVGYVGRQDVASLLIDALKRLEYRGYDSCGIAVLDNGHSRLLRTPGRVADLEVLVNGNRASANGVIRYGIGHTRWATHGRPNETNAHPHVDCSGSFIVAHNGIVENFSELKKGLSGSGHCFRSDTDTEVLAHLVEQHFRGSLADAVGEALAQVDGTYGCVFVSQHDKDKIVAARRGAPLVIGLGDGENFIASDAPALLPFTDEFVYLEDGDIAIVDAARVEVRNKREPVRRTPTRVSWSADAAEKQGYSHFMLKEIHEQPRALRDTLAGRLRADGRIDLEDDAGVRELLRAPERLTIVACGTSLHAARIGKLLIEGLARLPVDVDFASEFRYSKPLVDESSLVIGISQSGETADTVAALEEAGRRGASLLSICNVIESSIARMSDGVLYTRAGIEIGVASTKSFSVQIAALALIALELGRNRGTLRDAALRQRALQLREVPDVVERMLQETSAVETMATRLAASDNCLYLGRGMSYPMALEGALKLKEVAYINAQGYASGEMKHGPIALIDDRMSVVAVAPRDSVHRKTVSNVQETKVRDGHVLAIATEGDEELAELAAEVVFVPAIAPWLSPLLTAVPLQLLAFHAGVARGCDVDKPRNLAKSVTVE